MKNYHYQILFFILLINAFTQTFQTNLKSATLSEDKIYTIDQAISGDTNHKKAEYDFATTDQNIYFKYQPSSALSYSMVTTFRIEFDSYSTDISDFKVLCANVDSSKDDTSLINTLNNLKISESACIDGIKNEGYYDGVVKLDKTNTKLGIILKETKTGLQFKGRINLRVTERALKTDELKPTEQETYTLIPFSINIESFRKIASKILFYSYSRNLQMLYAGNSPYPDKLFGGKILNVYTNPNMVRQKYHGANIMTLLVYPKPSTSYLNDDFLFEVKLFESKFLLDYFVSSNSEGRTLNKPLLINMTECTSPYYAILNYNREETKKAFIIDQIYGKMKSLSVAYNFTKNTWDEMLANDMNEVNIEERKYILPENAEAHIDVYKIECETPLMFNFYYTDESGLISKMNYGDINLFTLAPHESVNIPFFSSIVSPEIIIEIYNPFNEPTVVIKAQEEDVYTSNSLIKLVPFTLANGITIKERGGLSDTRIIVKVGFSNSQWIDTSDPNVKYNSEFKVYAFRFPLDMNYTYAVLKTSGTDDEDDNVKYCFNTNIGAALEPSSENCYRVSKDNSYNLTVFNPLNIYKDYIYDNKYVYYVTFKTETTPTSFTIEADLKKYDTTNRNFNGISNKVTITEGKGKSILTQPSSNNIINFVQIQVCDTTNSVKAKVINPLNEEVVAQETTIPANTKNKYITFNNFYLDSEIIIEGADNTNIFLRTTGLPYEYEPTFEEPKITFDSTTNTINIEIGPIQGYEFMEYTVIIDRENVIKNKGYTLCDFVNYDLDKMGLYHKSIYPSGVGSIQINFGKAGLKPGETFDAIVYMETKMFSRMAFLSDVIQDKVGDITIDTIHEITEVYPEDNDYVYTTIQGSDSDSSYYFSYLPDKTLDIPIGAMRIELDESATGSFTGVYCAFADNDTDALGRIEAVEKMVDDGDSYCIGSKSKINSKRYNYIFKYETNKEDNSPKMLVIKLINGNLANGKFNVYIRKEQGEKVTNEEKKYGEDESNKKSLIPYIVDLKEIRGDESDKNYVSKMLLYSKNYELQMYYIPKDKLVPVKLFSGNIALVYTKLTLAEQKYHATTLILLSENLEEDSAEGSFRFHTKMFKSEDQIEFFVSNNPDGRTLNFPLSLEMNVCTPENKKLYYLLNYNKPEPLRTLHLDMIYGSYIRARIAKEINEDTWDDLLSSMTPIYNYQTDLPEKSQHIDVIEIECLSPLLINAYYSYDSYEYHDLKQGEIVVKDLDPNSEFSFTLEPQEGYMFYYTLSLFNQVEVPYVTLRFSDGTEHYISGNTLQDGKLMSIPTEISIINKVKSKTRFIFKIGLNIDKGDWEKDDSVKLDGTLFINKNKYVYQFPLGSNKRSYTKIDFLVNGVNSDVENVKFCYSTNLGVAMETSKENCFRTGKYIPYTLSFINPLIVAKDYENTIEKYYISFSPFDENEFIKLTIDEQKYDSPNRNEEGVAKKIVVDNKLTSSILSLTQYYTSNILIQLRSCTDSIYPLTYRVKNALSGSLIREGKTYYKTDLGYGIIYPTDNTYVETEVELVTDKNETNAVSAFLKHSAIGYGKIAIQDGYTEIVFDETKNSVTIKKPIFNEEFTITVIVDLKGTLGKLTQCDLAFGDKSKFGKYSQSFISVKTNYIIHFIDFAKIEFDEGTEFDLIVYAEQKSNSKMEFLYPVFQGKVGKVSGVEAIDTYIEDDQYVTLNFQPNLNSNYLYYDFPKAPLGLTASLKITTSTAKVTKVGCVFVSKYASDSTMISAVNNAMVEGKSACLDLGSNNSNEFNALINANIKGENSRLVMQVIYGLGDKKIIEINDLKDDENTINIKIAGKQFGDYTGTFELDEKLAPTPYVIDLEEIRKKKIDSSYVSKILFYSNTTKMAMYYINEESTVPVKLFNGYIMLVYTNPDIIYQKYDNAKTMILTTDAIGQHQNIIDVKYFDSPSQIQYYYLDNHVGRELNSPTAIEMTSCDLPYYYILNYNNIEKENRKLHIDTIFGELQSMKIAYSLDYNSWNKLVDNMIPFDDEQIILPRTDYPFDIIEVKCKLPLLLNLYYADPIVVKTEDIMIGDIVILPLSASSKRTLKLKPNQAGPFVYSFNIFQGYSVNPHIVISFDGEPDIEAKENGLHIKDSRDLYSEIEIENKDRSSGISTRVIFKLGYVMESTFTEIGNKVYQNKDVANRTINLYGYKHDSTSKRLNYTGVDFKVSTEEENVKFCYSTNLGAYINPSITNCYRVGKNNPYVISTRNPLIMYRNYLNDNVNNYYVGFRTVELNQNIIITPTQLKYDTTERNLEGAKNKITITGEGEESVYSTILTAPEKNNPYIFTHIHICTKDEAISYEFYNAYNNSKLGYKGTINANPGYDYMSVPNTKLDTELKLTGKKDVNVFVRHVGIDKSYQPYVEKMKIGYDEKNKRINWTQPILNEEFKYTIYVDKIGSIKNKKYTLCDIVDTSKLGRYSQVLTTSESNPNITLDFSKPDLVDCTEFDVIIVAEQTNKGKLTLLSPVYNSKGESSDDEEEGNDEPDDGGSNTGLIVIIAILVVIIIGGGIAAFFIIRKYRSKGVVIEDGKATSMAMLGSTKNEKLVESQAVVDP